MLRPFDLSATPPELSRRAPTLGEHTHEILAELGMSDEQIARFEGSRTI
ncbi:MAG: hypothetical protein JOZ79_01810 [Sphingomonas sp.]|nr:hypothetical protein [Sphingomonas sp.]